ncbi:hypothetical protein SAMN05421823_106266 [Catalinimonas alkaloidigena]|uniref:Uncharacterized protein n=1 Tax=Catalinimonas alkaloidigena TaxID=1075417 RepID=A0A1G9KWG1_9BACT|nr:hypothetical protein [Catalinimonas alkaloidigena]SDL53695.1 hypothetical protein SAMN05421823_106266 [Catalinimonas alkaloidigena]
MQENRDEELDRLFADKLAHHTRRPAPHLWNRLEATLADEKSAAVAPVMTAGKHPRWWYAAAAAVLLPFCVWVGVQTYQNASDGDRLAGTTAPTEMTDTATGLAHAVLPGDTVATALRPRLQTAPTVAVQTTVPAAVPSPQPATAPAAAAAPTLAQRSAGTRQQNAPVTVPEKTLQPFEMPAREPEALALTEEASAPATTERAPVEPRATGTTLEIEVRPSRSENAGLLAQAAPDEDATAQGLGGVFRQLKKAARGEKVELNQIIPIDKEDLLAHVPFRKEKHQD